MQSVVAIPRAAAKGAVITRSTKEMIIQKAPTLVMGTGIFTVSLVRACGAAASSKAVSNRESKSGSASDSIFGGGSASVSGTTSKCMPSGLSSVLPSR